MNLPPYSLPFSVPFIRWANQVVFSPGTSMTPRRIYDHESVYVMAGRGEILLEGRAHAALSDRLFLVQPRVWHLFRAASDERLVLLGVHFDWTRHEDADEFAHFRQVEEPVEEARFRVAQNVPGWELGTTPFLELKGRLRVRRLLEEIVTEYAREDEVALLGSGALLAAAIAQMARETAALAALHSFATVPPDALRRVERARALLETPRERPLSIEAAAAQVGWSADHLRRMFRAALGSSPNKIQTAARIRHAKELLRYEHQSIAKVAEQCGFDDPSHFARVFKAECGQTPREFLAQTRQN